LNIATQVVDTIVWRDGLAARQGTHFDCRGITACPEFKTVTGRLNVSGAVRVQVRPNGRARAEPLTHGFIVVLVKWRCAAADLATETLSNAFAVRIGIAPIHADLRMVPTARALTHVAIRHA